MSTFADVLGVVDAGLDGFFDFKRSQLQTDLLRSEVDATRAAALTLPSTVTPAAVAVPVSTTGQPVSQTLAPAAVEKLLANDHVIAAQLQNLGQARAATTDRDRIAQINGTGDDGSQTRLLLIFGLVILAAKALR